MNTLKTVLHIAIAEARHVWKQPHLLAMLIILPIIFSSILSVLQSSDVGPVRILISRPDTPKAKAFEQELTNLGAAVEIAGLRAQTLVTTADRDAWVKLPKRPAARGDSNNTGHSQVLTLRLLSRDKARSAA